MDMKTFSRLKAVVLAMCLVTSVVRAAAPVALPDSYAASEDTTLSVSAPGVLGNDSDADGDTFTASLIATTTNGLLTLNANGSFTYRAATNFFGTDTFTYRARQSSSQQSATVAVSIAISPVNDAPRATNNSYSVNSGSALNIAGPGVLGNDFDVEGDALTALLVANPAQGSLALNADGSFSYTPNANSFGSDSFTYRARDAQATSAVATVSLTVQPAPIVVVTPPQPQTNCPGGTASFSVTATGTALRYQWLKGTTTLTGQTNSALVLPNLVAGDAGTFHVRIIGATNSITNSATLTINIPVAATSLTNFTRFVGSIAIYNTRVTAGTGPFTFAWLRNGAVIPSQTSSNLTLTNLLVEDSGLYSVVVSGACGSLTNSASLDVATCFPAVDVMLVIDRSGSMVGQPYTDARTACTNFVRNLQFGPTNDMCGLVAYSTTTILQQGLTNSMSRLEQAIHTLPPATNGTRISDGLTNAMAELFSVRHRSNALPIIVLMSDGLPNSGDSPSNVLYHAQLAKNAGARVFTVGLGAVDPSLMANAASSTNDYFFTTNSSQLAAFFDAIATIICRPPTNIVAPSDVTVCAGVNASFNVTASGCEGFQFQWRQGGVNIFGQTNSTFTVTNAQPANAGIYSVVVSALCRTVTNSATLTVNSPAQTTVPPASQISFRDSNVVFSVTAIGTALSYEWRRNGNVLSTSDTLALNNLTTNDAGTYCVFVTGALCGGTVSNCVTLTISNRAPVAVNDSYTVNEDTALVILPPGVLVNDSDADGDPLTAVIVVPPTHGTLTLNTNGGFIYTPDSNYHGPDTFTYRATDGASNSNPATVSISVTPMNDVPVANDDAYSMTAGTLLNIAAPGVLANDTDVENTGLATLLESQPANGTLTLNGNGSFTYQPNTNFSGSDSFTYRALDGGATSGVATVSITVIPVPVVIVVPPTSGTNCPGGTTTFNVTATGTALTYQWTFNGEVISGVTNRSLAVRNINATNAGIYCAIVNGAAGGPITSCAELTVFETTIVTVPPTNLVVCEGTTAQFTVGTTGTQLGYQWSFAGTTLTNATNATLVLTNVALNVAGDYTVVVNGACGAPVTNTTSLVVNENVEIISAPTNQTSFVGSNVVFTVGAIGTGVIYEWYFNDALISTNSTLPLDNLSTNQAGTYCVVVRGVCGAPLTNCTTLTIQNRAPFAADDNYTTLEDQPLVVSVPGVLSNDGDIDGDTLTALLVSNPASGSLNFNANGSFTFTPSLNVTGTVTFTYRVSDTQLTSAPATVTITVTPINDAPVAIDDSYSINEDTTLTIAAAGVLANDSDVDGDTLSAVLVSNPASGSLNLNPNGSFTFTPSLNFTGTVTFTYRAHDSELSSGVATVTITVLPVNDTPVALNDAYTINEDTVLSITRPGILANDTDADGNTLTAVLVADVTHGALLFSANGSFFYTPNANYHGTDTFTYRATDGALTSAVATVTITINPTNDAPVAINDDAYTTLEDTALTILPRGILTNDVDVDGDVLTALLVSTTTHGTLTLSNNGAFFYTPSLNYTGVDVFTYRATDGFLTSSVATVTITVLPVNDTPVALDDNYSVNEDTALVISVPGVLGNDSDVDGNPLTTVLVNGVTHGTLTLSNNGAFFYTPSLNYTGVDVFTYRATDSALTSGVATVTITVLPVNDAPVALDDNYSVNEDTTLTIAAPGLLANDSDVDGNPLTAVFVSNPASGTLNLNTNGSFTFTPSLNFTGVVTFTYRASDSQLTSGLATVTITVLPLNDAPVAQNDSYSTPEDTVLVVPASGVLANDSDVDGDALTSVLITPPASGSLVWSNNGSFRYTPSLNFTGAVTFTYRASDSQLTSGVATVTITVTPLNDAPVANNDSFTMLEDGVLNIPSLGVLTNDFDVDGDALLSLLVSNVTHGTLSLATNGAFIYTPSLNYTGVDIFTYRATDGALTSGVATVTITITPVNDTPVALDDNYSVNEDTLLTIAAPGVLGNDSDVDGDPLRAALLSIPSNGTLVLNTNGSFTYRPNTNFNGTDAFTYRATDRALTSGVATVTITVLPVNDAPVALDDNYSVNEDTTLTIAAPGILANDSDVDGNPLTAALVSNPASGTLNLSTNGSFTYTPSLNFTGVVTFTYRASDSQLTSGLATVTITVLPLNDAPVAVDDAYTTAEDVTLQISGTRNILSNDVDVDGNALEPILVQSPTNGVLQLFTAGGFRGLFRYTPNTNFVGVDTFIYSVTDGTATSGVATVTITVTPVNDGPVAVDDTFSMLEDGVLNIPASGVLTNDIDVDGDTLVSLLVSNVTHGTLSLNTNGGFIYTPNSNYTGMDIFMYRATDGVLTSTLATVTIRVLPVNDAPVAQNDFYTVNEDTTLTVAIPGVLGNDSDVDLNPLTAIRLSNPASGTLNFSTNGSFTYTPSLNFTGLVTFTYRASDSQLTSDVATVTITVLPLNDAPVAQNDSYSTPEDTALVVSLPGVLSNDSDVDGDPLTTILITPPASGSLVLSNNGSFRYTPSLNFTGVVTFTYRAMDGELNSGVATVTITVIPVNDPPTAGVLGDNYSVLEDATLTVSAAGVLANDGDVDGDPLTAVLVNTTAHGTLALNANGSFTYAPAANYFGPDSFTYLASDGLTSSAPAVVNITVIPVNDAPSFSNAGNQRVNMNAPAQSVNWASNISAGPTNESSQTLAFLVSNDNAALFSAPPAIAPNGTLTYTPAANAYGTANVRVRLQDDGGTANGGVDTSAEVIFAIVVNSPPSVSIVSPANGTALLFPATFSVISSPSDPDGTVTNVQFLVNGTNFLSVAEAPFYYVMSNAVPGSYQLRAIASDNFGLTATSAVVNIDVITNFVIATGPILLNHQNGLFEQFVTVSNRTSETWANGVRLFVQNLDTTNRVWNPTGTNAGVPYLDNVVSVPPGGSTVITVQYYVPNPRITPNPTLVATPRPFSTPTVVPRITSIRRADEGFEIQFTTQSSRFYFVQSSEDLIRWTTQPTPIAGTGGVVVSPQGSVAHRFFRVLLVP